MTLTLKVLRAPEGAPPVTRHLEGGTFSIGRGTENDLVLLDPDRHLSKRHCLLALRGSAWQVDDLSSNGTFYNGDETPMGQGAPRDLRDGDRLRLGPYEIEIRLDKTRPPRAARPPIDPAERRSPENPFNGEGRAPPPVHAAPPRAVPDGTLLGAFLAGAGMPAIKPANPQAAMAGLGRAMRAMVAGIRAALSARAAVKGEFRIDQTMVRARGNNPLKFSADDNDALAALLGGGRQTDMDAAAAITDALRDMRLHELASMAAMQAAVRTLLDQFDPARIRGRADEGGGLAMLPAQRKARAWAAFEKLHGDISQAMADDFDSVFGKAFARAYEKAMKEARAQLPPDGRTNPAR